eukprot:CFRG8557T1
MSFIDSNAECDSQSSYYARIKAHILREDTSDDSACSCGLKVDIREHSQHKDNIPFGQKIREFIKFVGPGWLICVAYSDPGNMYASIASGANYGYSQIWILWWAIVFSLFVGTLCTFCAHYTNHSLAELMWCAYPAPMRVFMWLSGEICIIFTDMPEVIGFGVSLKILLGWPLPVGICLSLITTMIFLFLERFKGRYLEIVVALFMSILGILLIVEMAITGLDVGEMFFSWVVPTVPSGSIFDGLGIVGAVVMPHNLFLQTTSAKLRNKLASDALAYDQQIEAKKLKTDTSIVHGAEKSNADEQIVCHGISGTQTVPIVSTPTHEDTRNMLVTEEHTQKELIKNDDHIHMNFHTLDLRPHASTLRRRLRFAIIEPIAPVLFTFVMSLAIMCIAASVVYPRTQLDPADPMYVDPDSVGLENFPDYFRNGFMKYLWAASLLASAQAGGITTTLTGQYLMDGLMHLRIKRWKRALLTRSLAIIPGVIVTSINSSPDATNQVISIVNAVLAVLLPVFLLPLIRFTASSKYMGRNRIPFWFEFLMYAFALFVTVFALISFVANDGGMFGLYTDEVGAFGTQMNIIQDVTIIFYLSLLAYLLFAPHRD